MIAAAQSSLYIFLDVVSSDTYRTISGVQLGYCLACLLVNPSFLQYSILLCRLHTDKFPQVRSFLTNRQQRVVLRGHYSSWTAVLSGVPQGTVLGPILFLININDITRNVESQSKLFADDMKVYKVLRNVHEDTQILQDDLNALEQWSIDWQLSFNTTKCEVMRISQKNQ